MQITDGSVNPDRHVNMDWRPNSPETACFDPYKWNRKEEKEVDEKEKNCKLSANDGFVSFVLNIKIKNIWYVKL